MYFFEHAVGITLLKYNIHIGKYKNPILTCEISVSGFSFYRLDLLPN